jgi:hypothetical protein
MLTFFQCAENAAQSSAGRGCTAATDFCNNARWLSITLKVYCKQSKKYTGNAQAVGPTDKLNCKRAPSSYRLLLDKIIQQTTSTNKNQKGR